MTETPATTAERSAAAPSESPATKAMHWAKDYEDALALADEHDDLVLLDFYTDWCGWCKKLDRDVFAQESFQEAASGVIAVKVNAEKNRPLANRYGATSYPRLFFLDSKGHVLEEIRGYLPLPKFTAKVTQVKAGDTEYSRYQKLASDPNNVPGVRQFARFLSDTDRQEEAIPYWQQVHDVSLQRLFANPNMGRMEIFHREALLELGRAYVSVGLEEVGIQHLEEVATSQPGTNEAAEARVLLAEVALENDQQSQAREHLQRVVQEAPRSRAARTAQVLLARLQATAAR